VGLNDKKLHGRDRLVPMRPTGIGYQVRHGIKPLRVSLNLLEQCTKCSLHLAGAGLIPYGRYFLYADEGRVHQLDFSRSFSSSS